MAVSVITAANSTSNNSNSNTVVRTKTLTAGTDCLVVTEGNVYASGGTRGCPATMTYGTPGTFLVNMTLASGTHGVGTGTGGASDTSIWYVTKADWDAQVAALGRSDVFTGVSYTITGTYPAGPSLENVAGITAIGLGGVSQSTPAGTAPTPTIGTTSQSPGITISDCATGDYCIALMFCDTASTNVTPTGLADLNCRGSNALATQGQDGASGAFSWSLAAAPTYSICSAVAFKQVGVTADPLTVIGRRRSGGFHPGRMFREAAAGLLVPDLNLARI